MQSDIETIVKFFDPAKGYGFVQVCDGSPDAFLPASAVEQANCTDLQPGDIVFCEIVQGPRSPTVTAIHYVDRNPFGRSAGYVSQGTGDAKVRRPGPPSGGPNRRP